MKSRLSFALLMVLATIGLTTAAITNTALDDYVNKPDAHYSYKIISNTKYEDYTQVVINMTSQEWLSPNQVDRSIWWHYLTLCIPNKPRNTDIGFMYIDGGDNTDPAPTSEEAVVYAICVASNTVVAHLMQEPVQPVHFSGDPLHKRRVEDEIIAYTWAHFINNTAEPNWLLRLPMTKAAVRAMDTIEDVTKNMAGVFPVKKFVVAGASKRGWATWTVGAVEYNKRVVGMVPMVIPVLKMQENFGRIWRCYGDWPFALDDYLDMGIMHYLNDPVFNEMAAVVDPITYNERYKNIPKYLVFATGDEFFPPDQPNVFLRDVLGETWARLLPNTEHALIPDYYDVARNIETFYYSILANRTRPTFDFQLVKSNTSTAQIIAGNFSEKPTKVFMWHARTLSATQRDFRLLVCSDPEKCINPVIWYYTELNETSNGVYIAEQSPPPYGWTGFLIEVVWTWDDNYSLFSEYSDFKSYFTRERRA